jgi:hypothetical protein
LSEALSIDFSRNKLVEPSRIVYFQPIYAALRDAFARQARFLRWGSGADDVQRRLGFELETNNNAMFISANPLINSNMQIIAKALL